jgi:spore coat polysaccharide biosynthesis protein SpsF (cytidylyltransferase family)
MITAIVQARMGSQAAGKVLMSVEGKPMLWHLVNWLSGRSCGENSHATRG